MNRITKVLLGAGAFLCMSGGLLALTGWAAGADTQAMRGVGIHSHSGSEHSYESAPYVSAPDGTGYIEDMALEPFTKLDVDLSLGDVTIMTGDSYGVILDWQGRNYLLSYKLDDDTLQVRSSQSVNWNLAGHSASVTVYLPVHTELEEMDVHTSLGDAYLDDVCARQLKASSDLGDVSLYDTTAGELDVTCSMGDIWLDHVTAGSAELTNSMGNINAETLTTEQSLDVEASMGDIDLRGDLCGETDIEASMGGVILMLSQEEASYSYELDVSMGQLTVNDQTMPKRASRTGGPHHLEIENHMGDICVTFAY